MDSETIEFICIRFDVESHSALVSFFPACTQSRRAYCLIRIAAFSYRLILFCLPLHQFISRNVFIFFFSFFFLSVLFPSRIANCCSEQESQTDQWYVVGATANKRCRCWCWQCIIANIIGRISNVSDTIQWWSTVTTYGRTKSCEQAISVAICAAEFSKWIAGWFESLNQAIGIFEKY